MQLESLMGPLRGCGIDVTWYYLGRKENVSKKFLGRPSDEAKYLHIGEPLMGGNLFHDLVSCFFLWAGFRSMAFKKIIGRLLALKADLYWVVAHNEGLLIANELMGKVDTPVHITVHDDPPFGVFARSRRYRWFAFSAKNYLSKAFVRSASVSVTAEEMRFYYRKELGVDSIVAHPFVPSLPEYGSQNSGQKKYTVGFIGNIYSLKEFRVFCRGLMEFSRKKGPVRFIIIGITEGFVESYLKEFSGIIEAVHFLSETEAVERLHSCSFFYAMYPFASSSAVFRQTSFQTKLGTYIQAQRPILGHTPRGSTLHNFIDKFKVGMVCDSLSVSCLSEKIGELLHMEPDRGSFERARSSVFGSDNVRSLSECFHSTKPRGLTS